MTEKEIELLIEICEFYRTVTDTLGVVNKLNNTMIEDALIRLRDGEYKIVDNLEY